MSHPEQAFEYSPHAKQIEMLEDILAFLGFALTPTMVEIREDLRNKPEHMELLLKKWDFEVQLLINGARNSPTFQNLQLGVSVAKAMLYLDLDLLDEFNEAMNRAIAYAPISGNKGIVESLRNVVLV